MSETVESQKKINQHISPENTQKKTSQSKHGITWVMPCITTTVTIVVGYSYDVHISLLGDSFGLFV